MRRSFLRLDLLRALGVVAVSLALAGCRQDMHDAPRYEPLEASTFFANGQASRMLVANTVPRGLLREDAHLNEGNVDGQLATDVPDAGHRRR